MMPTLASLPLHSGGQPSEQPVGRDRRDRSEVPLEVVRLIVAACQLAPSGDNCQPWRYRWDGATLAIHHDAERARHPLNRGDLGSLLALGCVVESAVIAATAHGVRASVGGSAIDQRHDGQAEGSGAWAQLQLVADAGVAVDDRVGALAVRATDRRLYQGGGIDAALGAALTREAVGCARVAVLGMPDDATLAYITQAECGVLEDAGIFRAVMAWVRFSRRAAAQHRDGLPLRNLGVRARDVPMLLLLRACPWLLRPLAACGARRLQRRLIERQIRSSAGLVLVTVADASRRSVVDAGRLAMRTWLALTQAGYGVQPLTLSSLHAYRAATGERLSPVRLPFHAEGAVLVARAFRLRAGELPIWMFRTGPASPLPRDMRTLRLPLDAVLTVGSGSQQPAV